MKISRKKIQVSENTQTGSGKQHNKKLNMLGGYAGRVMVGNRKQPICIPAGTSKVVIGKTQEKLPRGSYMVEATDDDNLPCGVSVNYTYVNPTKAKQVSVILLNTNSYNVWIRQRLCATTIWDVELKDLDYEPIITKSDEANTFEVKLQTVPPEDLREEILSNATEVNQETNLVLVVQVCLTKRMKNPLLAKGQTQRIPISTLKRTGAIALRVKYQGRSTHSRSASMSH